ncbi:DUF3558 domain-containing protein [Nocardia vinacea]|uniref:DUF3558 domain-containing protein n=1 Tax=Nocardia vinacea TaxID=96468 RepID=A0ABZ1Z3R3_9NOCA|nr:DUF3558 family protein [Nocardia vinacea]
MTGFLVGLPAMMGCGSSTSDTKPSMPVVSFAAEMPQGYNPCQDVPQGVLDAEQLHSKEPVEGKTLLPVDEVKDQWMKYRGCRWLRTNSYRVEITTTVLTVDIALWYHNRNSKRPDAQEFTIAGRRVISRRPSLYLINVACVANVDMKGGSLAIDVYDSTARAEPGVNATPTVNPGRIDVCVLARNLAEQIVPSLPATA